MEEKIRALTGIAHWRLTLDFPPFQTPLLFLTHTHTHLASSSQGLCSIQSLLTLRRGAEIPLSWI